MTISLEPPLQMPGAVRTIKNLVTSSSPSGGNGADDSDGRQPGQSRQADSPDRCQPFRHACVHDEDSTAPLNARAR